ncbi:aldose epimerase family protein [Psychromarinibacter sp. S121]|uniref:aldose epimerase family protein n=1 Tax=Psychromarinibacter sp. S121 TaxID=3415127 RepID=UPI003C7A8213
MAVETFGTTQDGETVYRLLLGNGPLSVAVLTYGANLQDVRLEGVAHSLTVGSPELAAYEGKMASCGGLMGPVVNRIAGGTAEIDGTRFEFTKNFGGRHTIHGGDAAFHRRVWEIVEEGPSHAVLRVKAPDGEAGFPGNRVVTARFDVLEDATLRLTVDAETDAPTLMNLANHSYWRMDDAPTVKGQVLTLAADHVLPRDEDMIVTGEILPVDGTRFDYREGRALEAGAEGLIDNSFCLSRARVALRPVASLQGQSGVRMEMSTTEPGVQVFDGHILELPQYAGNDGPSPVAYCGVALEAQFWPGATAHPEFPSFVLRPGDDWQQVTEWRFAR